MDAGNHQLLVCWLTLQHIIPSREHWKLYFTNSAKKTGVFCLSHPRVPTSHIPDSQRFRVPRPHVPGSPRPHVPRPRVPSPQVPRPRLFLLAAPWFPPLFGGAWCLLTGHLLGAIDLVGASRSLKLCVWYEESTSLIQIIRSGIACISLSYKTWVHWVSWKRSLKRRPRYVSVMVNGTDRMKQVANSEVVCLRFTF